MFYTASTMITNYNTQNKFIYIRERDTNMITYPGFDAVDAAGVSAFACNSYTPQQLIR